MVYFIGSFHATSKKSKVDFQEAHRKILKTIYIYRAQIFIEEGQKTFFGSSIFFYAKINCHCGKRNINYRLNHLEKLQRLAFSRS